MLGGGVFLSDTQKKHYLQSRLILLKAGITKAKKEGDYKRVHHFQEAITHVMEEMTRLPVQP